MNAVSHTIYRVGIGCLLGRAKLNDRIYDAVLRENKDLMRRLMPLIVCRDFCRFPALG